MSNDHLLAIAIDTSEPCRHVVRCAGEIDLSCANRLSEALQQCDAPKVLADLSRVSFMDSSGIAELLVAKRKLEANGHELSVVGAQGVVRGVFEILGLTELLGD